MDPVAENYGARSDKRGSLNLALLSSAAKACPENQPFFVLMNKPVAQIFSIALAFAAVFLPSAHAQDARMPLLQDIQVVQPSPTPLIQKTGSSVATTGLPVPISSSVRTMFPALAQVSIPGYSGVLVESLDGSVVIESNAGYLFNPASNVKIATAYAVLKTFGPEFRFITSVYTDGVIDRSNGRLNGNLYVSGRDPVFNYEHAVTLAHELNKLGIHSVAGDLIVTDNFVMSYSGSPVASSQRLYSTIDPAKRSATATKSWMNYLSYSGKYGQVQGVPGVSIAGKSYVQPIPSDLHLLFTHESTPIREILKATLCYSNNFLSERLGDLVGGPYAVARLVQLNANVPPGEFSLATSSGLGYNRVTPNAMMKLLRTLRADLARYKMTFADIMPVAGIDKGTLEDRFDTFERGSLVGKTGTLGQTDGGASSLAGEINTKNGRLLFVIFNQKGGVARFRGFQNSFISLVQWQFGGPAPFAYDAASLETRLARSRISYPASNLGGGN